MKSIQTNTYMKSIHRLMMMYAAMGMMMPEACGNPSTIRRELTPQEIEEIERIREEKALQRKLNKGLKEWDIYGIHVIALNEKNAIRKANNIIKLLKELEA